MIIPRIVQSIKYNESPVYINRSGYDCKDRRQPPKKWRIFELQQNRNNRQHLKGSGKFPPIAGDNIYILFYYINNNCPQDYNYIAANNDKNYPKRKPGRQGCVGIQTDKGAHKQQFISQGVEYQPGLRLLL